MMIMIENVSVQSAHVLGITPKPENRSNVQIHLSNGTKITVTPWLMFLLDNGTEDQQIRLAELSIEYYGMLVNRGSMSSIPSGFDLQSPDEIKDTFMRSPDMLEFRKNNPNFLPGKNTEPPKPSDFPPLAPDGWVQHDCQNCGNIVRRFFSRDAKKYSRPLPDILDDYFKTMLVSGCSQCNGHLKNSGTLFRRTH